MKRVITLLWFFTGFWLSVSAQPCGLEDTLSIAANSNPNFAFEIFNIFNDDLSDPDQGVCAVEIEFLHEYVDNLELSLTSPAGQTVTLIGPDTDQQFAFTALARWDISFLPCASPVSPDPNFLERWDNAQANNFVLGGQYDGSYYPFDGCLEDFDTGPVNGTWTISVNNTPSPYEGAVLGFRIVFCDERGVDCCFAASGNLLRDDILTCVGDSSLAFTPEIDYQGTPPDTVNYGYTYLIGEDSVLLEYDSLPDLTGFAPGRYQICGMSYRRDDRDSFPAPNGVLTIDSLRRNLGGLLPDFCAEVTDSCIEVRIVPQPVPTSLQETLCTGDTLLVGDSSLTSTGNYQIIMPSYAGCDSLVNVDLEVLPPIFTDVDTTICTGESVQVGDSTYQATGNYVDTLLSSQLCDSIVTLDLQVLDTAFFDTTLTICEGEQFVVGDSVLTEGGDYSISLVSAQGCDSLVRVDLRVIALTADIAPPDTLSCDRTVVTLDGSGSLPAAAVSYEWQNATGTVLGSAVTQAVNEGGIYTLSVSRTESGQTCTVTDTVEVPIDTLSPVADAGLADTLTCTAPELSIGGANTSTGMALVYSWESTGGHFTGSTATANTTVDSSGTYTLIVRNTANGCADSSTVRIESDQQPPVAASGPDTTLTCNRTSLRLDGSASSAGPAFVYDWTAADGSVPADGDTPTPLVSTAGIYQLVVSDSSNGCTDTAIATVTYDTLSPQAIILPPDTLNCDLRRLSLQAQVSQAGTMPIYNWQSPGGNILSGAMSLSAEVDVPAVYEFVVVRSENGCRDTAQVNVVETISNTAAQVLPPDTLSCATDEVTLDGSGSSAGSDVVYAWSTQAGQIESDTTVPTVEVSVAAVYTLIVTDTFTRCADTLSVEVPADTLRPFADAGPERELTCDSTAVTLDGSASSQNGPYTYDWLEVATTDLVGIDDLYPQVSMPGQYLLVVTDNSNGCFDTARVQVQLAVDTPFVQIVPPDILNCERTSITLDASASANGGPYSPSWSASGGGVITNGGSTLMPTVTAAGDYTLTVENDSTGCINTASITVVDTISVVNAALQAADTLSCSQTEVLLSADTTANPPDVVYQWSTGAESPAITIEQPGDYQLVALDTFTRCADTLAYFMPADTLPPPVEAGGGFELTCTVLQGALDGSGAMANDAAYAWSGPCIVSVPDSVVVTVDCPGTYTLTVQDTLSGCEAADTVVVTQDDDIPTAVIEGEYTLDCDSLTQTLDATASAQGQNLAYFWSGPGLLNGENSLTPTVDLGGMYTLLIEDTLTNCASSASVEVLWDTIRPVANAGIAEVLNCDSTTIEIGGVESAMGPDFTYEWSGPAGGFVAGNEAPFVEVSLAGAYTLLVTDTTNGCTASSTTTVFLNDDPPVAEAGPNRELNCAAPVVVLDGTGSTSNFNTTYAWEGPCVPSPADSNQVVVDCEGLYVLTVIDTATGCSAMDSVEVTRDPLLPSARLPDTLELSCETGTAILDASASDGDTFEWWFEGSPISVTGLMPSVDTAGQYTLVAFNAGGGCSDTAQAIVLLDCAVDVAIVPPDTLTCARTEVTIDASATVAEGAVTYQWSPPAANCIATGQGSPQLTVRCPGVYRLAVTNTISGQSDTLDVEVALEDDPPLAEAGGNILLTCDMPTNTLSAAGSSTGAAIGYRWEQLEDEFFQKDSFDITVDDDGTYFLIVTDSTTGCTAQDVVSVQRSDEQHDINFGSPVIPCLQDSFWFSAFVEPPGADYAYSWEGDIVLAAADSASVLVDTAGTLRLTVTNTENNCVTVREINLQQQDCIPCTELAPADTLNCLVDSVQLTASFCEPCVGCTVDWEGPAGGLLSPSDALSVWVGRPGEYVFTATDTLGFDATERVVVIQDTLSPAAEAGADGLLTCDVPVLTVGQADVADEDWSYQWSSEAQGGLPGDTLSTLDVSQPGTYTLQVSDLSSGCTATDMVEVAVDTLHPQAEAGASQQIDCTASTVSLDGSASDFGIELVYNWVGPVGAAIAGATTINPAVDQAGWYVLTVRDTTNGCTAQDSVQVTVSDDLPEVPDLPDTVLTCENPVVSLVGSLPPGDNFSSCWYFLDNDGNPSGPCVPDLVIPVSITGSFRFEVTNTLNGCTNRVDVSVAEDKQAPVVSLPDTMVLNCPPDTVSLAAAVAPDSLTYSYSWSGPAGGVVSGAQSSQAEVVAPGFYTLTAENEANGCTAAASTLVVPNEDVPTLTVGPDTSLNCRRTSVRLSASFSTESGAAALEWQTQGGQIVSGAASAAPLVDAPGWYTLVLTDLATGCRVQDSVQVVDAAFVPAARIDSVVLELNCRTDSLLLDATPSISGSGGALAYEWRRGAFDVLGNAPQQWIRSAGEYRLLVTDEESGCRDTLLFNVGTDVEPPEVAIGDADIITCANDTVFLRPSLPSSTAGIDFAWLGPDGENIPDASFDLAVTEAGNYTLVVTNIDNGCTASRSRLVAADIDQPEAVIAPPQTLNCDRTVVTLDGSDSDVGSGLAYEWSTVDGQLEGAANEVTVEATAAGWYVLAVTNAQNGCTGLDSVEVLQTADVITDAFWSAVPPACPGDSDGEIVLDTVLGGTAPFFFALGESPLAADTVFEGLPPGLYPVRIEDANGCTWAGEVVLPEAEGISVSLGPERAIRLGEQDTLAPLIEPAAYDSIWWWPAGGKPEGAAYIVAPTQTTVYQVWVQNERGCVDTSLVRIKVIDDLPVYVPNVFSPNGDGQNDVFMVFAAASIQEVAAFRVFDRWGDMVHEAENFPPNDPAYGWDGELRGYEMDSAVFAYVIEVVLADGRREVVAGEVLLLR